MKEKAGSSGKSSHIKTSAPMFALRGMVPHWLPETSSGTWQWHDARCTEVSVWLATRSEILAVHAVYLGSGLFVVLMILTCTI